MQNISRMPHVQWISHITQPSYTYMDFMYQDKSCLTFQDTSTYPQKQIMYNNHTKRDFMRKSNKSYRFFNKSLFLNQRIFAMVKMMASCVLWDNTAPTHTHTDTFQHWSITFLDMKWQRSWSNTWGLNRTKESNAFYRLLPRIATIVKMISVRVLHITMETPWVLHFKES